MIASETSVSFQLMAVMKMSAPTVMRMVSAGYMIPGPSTIRTAPMSFEARDIRSPVRQLLVEGGAHRLQLCEEVVPKVELDEAGDADEELSHPESEEPFDRGDAHDETAVERELRYGDTEGEIVDGSLEDQGYEDRRRLRQHQGRHSREHRPGIARNVRKESLELFHPARMKFTSASPEGEGGQTLAAAFDGARFLVDQALVRNVPQAPEEREGFAAFPQLLERARAIVGEIGSVVGRDGVDLFLRLLERGKGAREIAIGEEAKPPLEGRLLAGSRAIVKSRPPLSSRESVHQCRSEAR